MSTSENDPPVDITVNNDDELERMLAEAGRLADQMRKIARTSDEGGAVPNTIQIKDNLTECSSVDVAGYALTESSMLETKDSFSEMGRESVQSVDPPAANEQTKQTMMEAKAAMSLMASSAPLSEKKENSFLAEPSSTQDIQAAINASEVMARELQAMGNSFSISEDNPVEPSEIPASSTPPEELDQSDASPESVSPSPGTPPDASNSCDDSKTTVKISHVSEENKNKNEGNLLLPGLTISTARPNTSNNKKRGDGNIQWEKVEFTSEADEDYVPLKDYSKQNGANEEKSVAAAPDKQQQQQQHQRSGRNDAGSIVWKKLTPTQTTDEDYTPLADYSASRKTGQSQPQPQLRQQQSHFSQFRRQMRRRRKSRRRKAAVAVLVLVILGVVGWQNREWLEKQYHDYAADVIRGVMNTFVEKEAPQQNVDDLEKKSHAKQEESHANEEEEYILEQQRKQAAAEKQRLESQRQLEQEQLQQQEKQRQQRIQREESDRKARQLEKDDLLQKTCNFPLAGIISPVCRNIKRDPNAPHRVPELLQAMLQ